MVKAIWPIMSKNNKNQIDAKKVHDTGVFKVYVDETIVSYQIQASS